ncbi:uncharacterized protein LTR77_004055 [Saxophila tyrrhenica]|uniref:Alpha/beta hydrolase fold-3 domain-containing protein n=1 Tax=Saxophila tyrrhenica TaxID=1690608 RepID=A0AAV9PC39_9PEZI|nr:hypothetical protein LTR77_004055 [Saxophila tyrrhenica]
MADIKDWNALAKPDPEWDQAVNDLMGGNQPDLGLFPGIPELRAWITSTKLATAAQMGAGKIEGVVEEEHQVKMRDGESITVRTYRPEKKPEGGSAMFVVYHGGGWCIGGLENEELLARKVVEKLGAVVVNVDYRLAPEWKATSNASSLGADPSKGFVIGGTSAGGNITAVISLMARDEKLSPPITGTLLMIPFYVSHQYIPESWKPDYNSWEQNRNAPILSQKACNLFIDNYLPDVSKRNDPLMSPALWPTGLKGLPPAVFQVCGQDPLRDEALIVEREMREQHGIKTKMLVYPGQPHGFWSVLPTMDASKKFVEDSVGGVQWLLEQK